MRSRAWIPLVVTTLLFLSSPGVAADPLVTLPPSWVSVEFGEDADLITWGAPADGGSEVAYYVVYSGDEPIANVTGLSYIYSAASGAAGYSVAAVGPGGESVAMVGVPASSIGYCINWVEGFPPVMINVWECIDIDSLAEYVTSSPAPHLFIETPLF